MIYFCYELFFSFFFLFNSEQKGKRVCNLYIFLNWDGYYNDYIYILHNNTYLFMTTEINQKRFMFCRNCLNVWETRSDKRRVWCKCGSATIIDMDNTDILTQVFGIVCIRCHHVWFSRSKTYPTIKCKCGFNLRKKIGAVKFITEFYNRGEDSYMKLIRKFPKICQTGYFVIGANLNPDITTDVKRLMKIWIHRHKLRSMTHNEFKEWFNEHHSIL